MTLESIFAGARAAGRAAFIPYVVAGDPDIETTTLILDALQRAGADAVEIGIPYSDGLADGPTIAAAATRALAAGTGIEDALEAARSAYRLPAIIFSYYNPILAHGIERFARSAARAGVAGVIVPDLPLEECGELHARLARYGIQMPLLVAPSTLPERAARIAARSSGFVYVVSRLGVTGARRAPDVESARRRLLELRGAGKPLALGFGMSRPEHAREMAPFADGLIVGSALIDAYAGRRGSQAAQCVYDLAAELRSACSSAAALCT